MRITTGFRGLAPGACSARIPKAGDRRRGSMEGGLEVDMGDPKINRHPTKIL